MSRPDFTYDVGPSGIVLRLVERRVLGRPKHVAPGEWTERASEDAFCGLARIFSLADESASGVQIQNEHVLLPHSVAASLPEPQASALGLPPSVKYALQIDTKGLITASDFQISCRWIDEANRSVRYDRCGAMLSFAGADYRLPDPLYGLVEAIDAFRSSPSTDDNLRMASLARLQELIPAEAQQQINVDRYLSSFRVLHATAFSLGLKVQQGSFRFDPVLFGRRVSDQVSGPDQAPVSEAEGLLTEHQQDIFANERFPSADVAKATYLVERGTYVHLDPSLRRALTVVRGMQSADAEKRKRFAQSPYLYLKHELSDVLTEAEIERLFIETEQYSARILDIGVWSPPVLPWIKQEPNDWLPEKCGLQIGEQYLVLQREEIGTLRDQIKKAKLNGDAFVEFGDDRISIPATTATEDALSQLLGKVQPKERERTGDSSSQPDGEPRVERKVLIVEENFETLGYKRKAIPRSGPPASVPAAIRPALKRHQYGGLVWLQDMWRRGHPGALLADDMGLGKTLQALAFLAWLVEARAQRFPSAKGAILVVAPTGLLANWEKEHNAHLHTPGLGPACKAFGRHLALLKSTSTRDFDSGEPSLDHRRLQQSNWVLTTYETLRDHHLTFAAVPFACAVFDEMQKVKSPSSLLTRAAKTINAEFVIGLTGTPIENRLEDLWCIMDIVNPGHLGDLKSFSKEYQPDDHDALSRLHSLMLGGSTEAPAPMLRRMKANELDGLPEKQIHICRQPMPEVQARVYADVVTKAKAPEAGPMLETLHLLRGISLHPIWPPAAEIDDTQLFIQQSARLTETFSILDQIAARREKALIFLESLDLQDHLALMIRKRYGLKTRPMQINGEIAGDRRQKMVDEFQAHRGFFDVMILSPRAGGVGLTLTSANNVIHLSRWWNPAVEDQCTDRVYRIGQDRTVHVYYPMAVHQSYGESTFDELLNALLTRKRELSSRMLMPPVNAKADQSWFADNLGHRAERMPSTPVDLDDIDVMEPQAFERWALSRCIALGWQASSTPKSHDGGADGLLVHRATGVRIIVQCKHKQKEGATCGAEAVDDLLRARANYPAVSRMFALTNAARFSQSARDRAEKYGIELIDRGNLRAWPTQLA